MHSGVTRGADLPGQAEEADQRAWMLFEDNPYPTWVCDATTGRMLAVNAVALVLYGYSRDEFLCLRASDLFPGDGPATSELRAGSWPQKRRDGSQIVVGAVTSTTVFEGRTARLVVVHEEPVDAATHEHLPEAHSMAQIGQWRWELATDTVTWSDSIYEMFGVDKATFEPSCSAYFDRLHPEDVPSASALVSASVETGQPFDAAYRFLRGEGEVRWLRTCGRVAVDDTGRSTHLLGVCQDITAQKHIEEELKRQASHDPLTCLPNRTLFLDALTTAMARAARDRHPLAVLFVDLDRFKVVNDTRGHAHGDRLLVEVASRLRAVLRDGDTVARFGGDEFAVLCEALQRREDAVEFAQRILIALSRPVELDGQTTVTTASIGVALAPEVGATAESLLRDADVAMYKAKEGGRNRFEIFDHTTRERVLSRVREVASLRDALGNGQLRVYYQPVIDLASDRLAGVEALVRWDHPERGLVHPDEFITAAEESGLVVELGGFVLATACRELTTWRVPDGNAPPSVSVNLSARQIAHPSLVQSVQEILTATGASPAHLCLEITESALMEDIDASITVLRSLKALGVRLAIDDFGTGYSSLNYLRRFPVDVVKIDRSFVVGLGVDAVSDAIVAAVINLSHALGFKVVAEGVECEQQLVAVRGLHCDLAQGFLWSEALAPREASALWRTGTAPTTVTSAPVDLLDLLSTRTRALREVTGRPVVLQAPTNLAPAVADLGAVKTVLDHVLGNAVTYSPPDTPIVVGAASDRHWVRVSVSDFGFGMTSEESARCFEQFWQAEQPGGLETRGTGIGLYIARSLVEAMSGHIGVKSHKNRGSTFTVALPRSRRAAARPRPTGGASERVSEDSTIREFMRQIGVPTRRGS